ncbi:hypothetical protein NQZ68_026885 [Dissostichus eleginoides]|nr:hypothetical protein NQZ68_026885 [Dissostichus eleginoides]
MSRARSLELGGHKSDQTLMQLPCDFLQTNQHTGSGFKRLLHIAALHGAIPGGYLQLRLTETKT